MKVRKQVYDLTLSNLQQNPVWEFALDEEGNEGQDEATVRPYKYKGILNPSEGMFIVRASFTLADGTVMQGYLTPPPQNDKTLGVVQPVIITERGQVLFWCGVIAPSEERIAQSYTVLGKSAECVFPLAFESAVPLVGGEIKGSIPGFLILEDFRSGKTRVVQ